MTPVHGTIFFFAALVASILIRAPHATRSAKVKVAESRRGTLEVLLLVLLGLAVLLLPILHALTPLLAFADHPLPWWSFAVGTGLVLCWLWLFHRSHVDLDTNWSVTLELREGHRLITGGVYSKIRHPMYTSLFCHAGAQAFLLANWIAGPAMLVAFTLMFLARLGPEERMLRARFGAQYDDYARRTKRLVPFLW